MESFRLAIRVPYFVSLIFFCWIIKRFNNVPDKNVIIENPVCFAYASTAKATSYVLEPNFLSIYLYLHFFSFAATLFPIQVFALFYPSDFFVRR